ncbi:MAG TPA: HAMP domain-containing sensor histidine kinase [Gemmatimonadaceae bacterium]|nr:HAMP domain-containing sensor histidine kinase [Gemmatimonadaceae bacterium]
MSRLSFRQRLTLLTAVAIAVTVAGISAAVWVIAKHELYDQLDHTLAAQSQTFFNASSPYNITITPDGDVHGVLAGSIPIPNRARALIESGAGSYYTNTVVDGISLREYVQASRGGGSVAVLPLRPTKHALARIRFWILWIGAIGIGIAAALAAFVATVALRPVRRLTAAAETVAATGNLTERVAVTGEDELGRLAMRFNGMLEALEDSVGRQRRLVADASHELRTPLTAARTNVDLVREGKLPPEEVRRALDEASIELGSLTTLVSDLVELARGTERKLRIEEVQLDDLVASMVERSKSRSPQSTFVTSLSPTIVHVDATLVERAVSNLLDNAVKYSPSGAPIEVTVRDGEVLVADHGPGIAEEDLPRIFDRFYRSAAARSKPGAGLGLAIVREAAEAHGGKASAETTAGGARFRLTLPATA